MWESTATDLGPAAVLFYCLLLRLPLTAIIKYDIDKIQYQIKETQYEEETICSAASRNGAFVI